MINTPKEIFIQENMDQMVYGVNQDNIPGMVKYYRGDILDGYMRIKKYLVLSFMNFLDQNRPEGKMCLSNAECYDIDKAFEEKDFAKLERYIEKYRAK